MSKKTIKKVTKLKKKKESIKAAKKKPFDPIERKKELEAELMKANNMVAGLRQRLDETERTISGILGALELLKEME